MYILYDHEDDCRCPGRFFLRIQEIENATGVPIDAKLVATLNQMAKLTPGLTGSFTLELERENRLRFYPTNDATWPAWVAPLHGLLCLTFGRQNATYNTLGGGMYRRTPTGDTTSVDGTTRR